jgi:CHAT domain-containing protein
MTQYHGNQEVIRRYLLGDVADKDHRQSIEERLLTDDEYYEELLVEEDELIDQYVSDALSEVEQRQFEMHFLATPERHQKLRFARALKRVVSEASPVAPLESAQQSRQPFWLWRWFHNPYLRAAAAAVIVIGLGFGVWRTFFHISDADRGLIALNTAYRNQRPTEARITNLDYAPFGTVRGDSTGTINYADRDRAERILLDAVHDDPGAETHHALGRLYLAGGQLDKAIDQFEQALKSAPNDARLHSDLGAALLERGKQSRPQAQSGSEIEDLAKSLDHLNKALDADDSLLDALFNRALCYGYMMLPRQAADDWRRYIERDPTSRWADEARRNLDILNEQPNKTSHTREQLLDLFTTARDAGDDEAAWNLISKRHTATGNSVVTALLDSYLDLKVSGQEGAAGERLQSLAYAAQLESRKTGDLYVSDLARSYGKITPEQLPLLVRARGYMRDGNALFSQSRFGEAITRYEEAQKGFAQSGIECEAVFAAYRIGHSRILLPELAESRNLFAGLSQICQSKQFRWLFAQCLYRLAHVELNLNEYSSAIEYSRQALMLSEQIGDANGILKTLVQLADEYDSLNDAAASLGFLRRGLTVAADIPAESSQEVWGVHTTVAFNLNALQLHRAAIEYQREALRLALEANRPLLIARSYDYLASTYSTIGNHAEAISHAMSSARAASAVAGEPGGIEMTANSHLHLGDIYRKAKDYPNAISAYDQSLRLYASIGLPLFNYPAHKGKLLSYMAQGDDQSVENELRAVMNIIEGSRSSVVVDSQRSSFFEQKQSIYDLATDFAYTRRGDARRAFDYAEASRARSLLDIMQQSVQVRSDRAVPDLNLAAVSASLPLAEIQQRMPGNVQILQYAVLDNKLLVWVVSKTSMSCREVKIDAGILTDEVNAYLGKVSVASAAGERDAPQHARNLYRILIEPVAALLDPNKLLCIIPDKSLHLIPFNALVSATTGKYLIEDHRLMLSPSATVFINSSRIAEGKAGEKEERLLSVGDPVIDRAAFPLLPALPSAGREAKEISRLYKSPRLMVKEAAVERRVKAEMEEADVIHFALHHVADERSPMLSQLLLTPNTSSAGGGESSDGKLQAHEIYGMKLPRTRAVILSACQTAGERQYGGEGAIGAARPFIAAGVPVVVASLWNVDSDCTATLMTAFHRLRALDGLSTAEALRRSQLQIATNRDSSCRAPFYWAPFVTIGGYAEF